MSLSFSPALWRWDRAPILLMALVAAAAAAFALAAGNAARTALPPGPPSAPSAATSPQLTELAAAHPGRTVEVIVQAQGPPAAAQAAARAAGGAIVRDLELIEGFVARVSAAGAARIARDPAVRAVSLNAGVARTGTIDPAALKTSYNHSIRSDRVWSLGFTGKGIGVAVIDTGIHGGLADFRVSQTDRRSRVVAAAVVNPGAPNVGDQLGHGTHIAGLIAGNGTNRDVGDAAFGRYAGVAPEANLISVKADDGAGGATVADVIDGLQFVVDHRQQFNIRVVNLSLRSTEAQSYRTDPLSAAVEQAWFAGIVVVAAAGNEGSAPGAVSYAPANDPYVITVGGVDDKGTKDINDDQLATWSSRGVTQDGFAKPDVVAPGARLVSTVPGDARYREMCPQCIVDDKYFRVGGTSMAAGVVTGEVALLLQAHPHLTPDQVKAIVVKRTRAVLEATSTTETLVDAQGNVIEGTLSATSGITGAEIAADKAVMNPTTETANGGLTANDFIDRATRTIDWTRMGWTRMGWTQAVDPLRMGWTSAEFMPVGWVPAEWSAGTRGCATWERMGWTRMGWTRMGWTAEQADAAESQCLAIDSTRASWTRMGWTRMGWTTSFDK